MRRFILVVTMGTLLSVLPGGSSSTSALGSPSPQASGGPLRVHPQNPRYLTDATGKPIYLAGSHAWFTIQGPDTSKATAFLDFIKSRGHNFTRLWAFYFYLRVTADDLVNVPLSPEPYLRTGPGTALDGGLKYDLTKPNPAYFQSLQEYVQQAGSRGIYVSVMLFGSYNQIRDNLFTNCPWHPSNNVNPQTSVLATGPDFFKRDPGVLALQEAHARRVIDALNEHDNVIWEIMNESMGAPGVEAWHDSMMRAVRAYEATKPWQHLVGMTGGPANAGGQKMFQSSADWVSPDDGTAGDYRNGGPGSETGKVVLNDSDHMWGVSYDEPTMRRWV